MKKALLLFVLTVAMQQLFAQSFNFGIKAGLNESTADLGKTVTTTSYRSGFNAGVFADIGFYRLSLEPGLFYTMKGSDNRTVITQNSPQPYSFNATGKLTYNYIEVPVNVLYNIPGGPIKIFIGGGPYWGLALSGTSQGNTTVNGTTTVSPTYNLTFGNGTGDLSRTDFGVSALAGITLKNGLLFNVDYGYGLTNIDHKNSGEIKNRVFCFSLGYKFL